MTYCEGRDICDLPDPTTCTLHNDQRVGSDTYHDHVYRSGHSTQEHADGTWSCADGFECEVNAPATWTRWPWTPEPSRG